MVLDRPAWRVGAGWPARTAVLILLLAIWPAAVQAAPPPLPVVGCPADGMSGPAPPPDPLPPAPRVSAGAARRLAYYAADGLAVLAPRGWHCVDAYGSDGALLLVTPRSYTAQTLPGPNSLAGPAVELLFLNGENSGREQVAEVFSRLFPFKRRFIRAVETADEPFGPRRRFPSGPYFTDATIRRSRAEVDYSTPPYRNGMGTFYGQLRPGSSPVTGAAMLTESNGVDSIVLLQVRLPPSLRRLTPVVLGAARAKHRV